LCTLPYEFIFEKNPESYFNLEDYFQLLKLYRVVKFFALSNRDSFINISDSKEDKNDSFVVRESLFEINL